MRHALLILAAAAPLAGCAHSATQMVEGDGMPRGALAVAAIDRGDLAGAERLLRDSPLDADNPARLINLGYVLLQQGRTQEALATWRQVLAAEAPTNLVTIDGRETDSHRLARAALNRHANRQVAAR